MRNKLFLTGMLLLILQARGLKAQQISEILGRPTLVSVTINTLCDSDLEIFREFGTSPGNYNQKSDTFRVGKDIPRESDLKGLTANTRYFYRTRFRASGSQVFQAGTEHTFQTPRLPGSVFTFDIEADPHLDNNSIPEAYTLTLQNIAADKPDFLLDLGDTFMSEKQSPKTQEIVTQRHLLLRSFFDKICFSLPLFLVIGNHEGEQGWQLTGAENSFPVIVTNTRKLYYPNPVPNNFYSGNVKEEPFVGLRENYYAFEWSDALFVVLDTYWYTTRKSDWGWTLGTDQYNWFSKTLKDSRAKYKFVFCHTLVGGYTGDARGGAEFAHLYEMGGSNADGSWGFDTNRPGWKKPIHTLMVENHVTAFIHGHDHFFGKQEKDGVIYLEVPQPSNRSLTNISAAEYGYVTGDFLPGRGYVRVKVSPDDVKMEYVRTYLPSEETSSRKNGEIAYSFSVKGQATGNLERTDSGFQEEITVYPNPFTSATTIRFHQNETSPVRLDIFDIQGQLITSLTDDTREPGYYMQTFDAAGLGLLSGIYIGRLYEGDRIRNFRMYYSTR